MAVAASVAYPTALLDHYRAPRHRGHVEPADGTGTATNPLCGDEVTFEVTMDGPKVAAAAFSGVGCAISLGVADMLAEQVLNGVETPTDIADVEAMIGMSVAPGRQRCATLALEALWTALHHTIPHDGHKH